MQEYATSYEAELVERLRRITEAEKEREKEIEKAIEDELKKKEQETKGIVFLTS